MVIRFIIDYMIAKAVRSFEFIVVIHNSVVIAIENSHNFKIVMVDQNCYFKEFQSHLSCFMEVYLKVLIKG